jgi:hypothetical protein
MVRSVFLLGLLFLMLPAVAKAESGPVGCQPGPLNPQVDVRTVQAAPNYAYDQSTSDLGSKAQAGNSYKPTGVGGPRWHTAGLTQSNIKIDPEIASRGFELPDHSLGCVYIDKIALQVVLAPTVWVANEFPLGTCMYQAVRDHELRHVNADKIVTNQHLARIRAALTEVAIGRGFFGPLPPDQLKAATAAFISQLEGVLQRETEAFYSDEVKAQQAIDTMQEYQRLSHLCPKQMGDVK